MPPLELRDLRQTITYYPFVKIAGDGQVEVGSGIEKSARYLIKQIHTKKQGNQQEEITYDGTLILGFSASINSKVDIEGEIYLIKDSSIVPNIKARRNRYKHFLQKA